MNETNFGVDNAVPKLGDTGDLVVTCTKSRIYKKDVAPKGFQYLNFVVHRKGVKVAEKKGMKVPTSITEEQIQELRVLVLAEAERMGV